MNSKLLPLIAAIGLNSTTAFAEQAKPTFSAGISTFAISQVVDDGYYAEDITFTGLQFIGSANLTDQVQAQIGFYSTSEENYDQLEMSGYSMRLNLGKGFQKKGLKVFGTFGLFNDRLTIKNNSSFEEKASGLEFGGGVGYNFEVVSVDYGLTIRTSSDYEKDEVWGSDTDVTTATGYLALTANF